MVKKCIAFAGTTVIGLSIILSSAAYAADFGSVENCAEESLAVYNTATKESRDTFNDAIKNAMQINKGVVNVGLNTYKQAVYAAYNSFKTELETAEATYNAADNAARANYEASTKDIAANTVLKDVLKKEFTIYSLGVKNAKFTFFDSANVAKKNWNDSHAAADQAFLDGKKNAREKRADSMSTAKITFEQSQDECVAIN